MWVRASNDKELYQVVRIKFGDQCLLHHSSYLTSTELHSSTSPFPSPIEISGRQSYDAAHTPGSEINRVSCRFRKVGRFGPMYTI